MKRFDPTTGSASTTFGDVDTAQTFVYNDTVYVKLDSVFYGDDRNMDDFNYNAMRLSEARGGCSVNRFRLFDDNTAVEDVNRYVLAHDTRVSK